MGARHGVTLRGAHLRVARATDHLPEVAAFYRDALGFEVVGSFEHHGGFDRVRTRCLSTKAKPDIMARR